MKAYHIYVNLCWMLAVSIAFSRGDADAPNPVVHNLECSGNETHSCSQGNVTSMDWLSRGCLCDDLCGEYGDCCYDVDNNAVLGPTGPTYEAGEYRCVSVLPDQGQYMTASCPSDWEDEEIAALCRAASPERMSFQEDPLLHIPVTSRTSNVTYANYHCAVCHSDTQDIDVWNIDLECPSLGGDNDVSINEKRSDLVFQEGQWGVLVNGSEQDVFHRCQLTLAVVNLLLFSGRSCRPVQDKCMENWDDETIEKLCHSYTSLVYMDGQWYKNSFCGICNNAFNSYVISDQKYYYGSLSVSGSQAFTVLIDFSCRSGSNKVGERCEVFDPFSKRTINLREKYQDPIKDDLIQVKPPDTEGNATVSTFSDGACVNETIPKDEFTMVNETVVVVLSNRTYYPGEYELLDDGVLVCSNYANFDKYSPAMRWVTLAGLSVSSLCLMVHLVAFSLVPHLRNLNGKNVASLSASLLGAYVTYILSIFADKRTTECYVFAVLVYYLFLTSFSWMNILGFDVFYTFKETRVRSGEQWPRFLVYSACGWLLPASAVVTVVAVDQTQPPWFPSEFLPGLGQHLCWFGQRKALLVFFGVPLFTCIAINVALFIATSTIIATTRQSAVRKASSSHPKTEFLLYLRLGVLMGLSWISSVLASYLESEVLWYVFIILNTLQGFFIFLAFTCRTKVWEAIAQVCPRLSLFT